MLTIEREIYNNKPWYKKVKFRRLTPKKIKNRPKIYSWLGFIFYNDKKLKENQTCYVYCPVCHTELISTNSYIGQTEKGLEQFRCNVCRTNSLWDFDVPTPVLKDYIVSSNKYYSPVWKEPTYDINHNIIRYGGRRE